MTKKQEIVEETEVTEIEGKKENKIMDKIKNRFSKIKGSKTTKVVIGGIAGIATIAGIAYLASRNSSDDECEDFGEDYDYEVAEETVVTEEK